MKIRFPSLIMESKFERHFLKLHINYVTKFNFSFRLRITLIVHKEALLVTPTLHSFFIEFESTTLKLLNTMRKVKNEILKFT